MTSLSSDSSNSIIGAVLVHFDFACFDHMLCIQRLKRKHELCGRGQINTRWLRKQVPCSCNCCCLCIAPAAFAWGKRLSYTVCLWTHPSAGDSLEMRTFTTSCGMARYAPWLICCLICPRPSLCILTSWAVICLHENDLPQQSTASFLTFKIFFKKVFADWHKQHSRTERALLWKRRWGVAGNYNYNKSNVRWDK